MPTPGNSRTLLVMGRLVAFAAAALGLVLMVGQGYDLFRYAYSSQNPTWGEVGVSSPSSSSCGSSSRGGSCGPWSSSTGGL